MENDSLSVMLVESIEEMGMVIPSFVGYIFLLAIVVFIVTGVFIAYYEKQKISNGKET